MQSTIDRIKQEKIVIIIRLNEAIHTIPIVEAVQLGGLNIVEVTATTPKAIKAIEKLNNKNTDLLIGVGSIVKAEDVKPYVNAGAKYIVTPALNISVIEEAHKLNIPVMTGAFTPSEILTAHQLGCNLIKVFPTEFLGPKYISSIKAPMPFLNLVPTGGVTIDNLTDWFNNGATAVGIGNSILNGFDPIFRNYEVVTANSRKFLNIVKGLTE